MQGLPEAMQRHHFPLGLQEALPEFDALRCPGFYTVLADSEDQAERMGQGVLVALSRHTTADWIAPDEHALGVLQPLSADTGPKSVAQWSLPGKHLSEALHALPEDFSGVRRKRRAPHLIVLEIPAAALLAFKERALRRWCWRWHLWLAERDACLLLLAHGPDSLALRERLDIYNDVIDGLMHLQPNAEEALCHLLYWRSDRGVCGVDDMILSPVAIGWRRQGDTGASPRGSSDEHLYLVQRAVIAHTSVSLSNWQVFEQVDEVVVQATRARAATVIVGIERSEDVETLARKLHGLRKSRGGALKLVVRELVPCLRYQDERLLILSGINMVIRSNVTFSHFFSRIEALQGQRLTRPVNDDVERLIKVMRPAGMSGRCPPAAFIRHLQAWLENDSAALASGLLITLVPAGGLSCSQAFAQCRIHRKGDMITVMEGRLYLFLFGCRQSDSDMALQRLFGMPIATLFGEWAIQEDPVAIAEEMQRLIQLGWAEQENLPVFTDVEHAREEALDVEDEQDQNVPRSAPLKLSVEHQK
ncbi:cellulose biosynthesis protein BcsE [Halomonas sp. PR-M31]|uniref:cellulose biosynthesis protein BcsE n=1 Tax=Halomonas sp. PR-M31 TaxID=1471202 RepID=UPI000650243C|nr:cellulose biosynthesis protein BcsE [Halomonas sp. PR-M31]